MKKIVNEVLVGERSLFKGKNLIINNSTFKDGESPLKESNNIKVNNSTFRYKYPLWYSKNVEVKDTLFEPMSRSGIWYTKRINFINNTVNAPKEFRRSSNINIVNTKFSDAEETLWSCNRVSIKDSTFDNADYLLMNSKNIEIDNITVNGNYFCDGGRNINVFNSVLNSKDSFWNCKNVYLENCTVNGEYFGWNSENVTLVNCKVKSHQGFCYMKNLKMINCTLEETDLAFEYSTVDVTINSNIESVKNPIAGRIECESVNEFIKDEVDFNKFSLIERKRK